MAKCNAAAVAWQGYDKTRRVVAAAGDMTKRGVSQPRQEIWQNAAPQPRYSIKQKTAQTESLGFPFSVFYTNESAFFL